MTLALGAVFGFCFFCRDCLLWLLLLLDLWELLRVEVIEEVSCCGDLLREAGGGDILEKRGSSGAGGMELGLLMSDMLESS